MDPQWQYNPLVIPLSISTLMILALLALGIRQRHKKVALPFIAMMLCLLIWMIMSLLEVIILNLRLSLLVADLSFIGITLMPICWLGVIMFYNGRERLYYRWLPWLVVIPILTNTIIWTNSLHHLWRGDSYRDLTTTWFPITIYDYGTWFYAVHVPFSYLIVIVSTFLLIRSLFFREKIYRAQITILLIAFYLPFLMDVIHWLGFDPVPHFNLAPIVFPISGLLLAWVLWGFRFLDLTPVARDLVLEQMEDLIVVLDNRYRVIDLNPAARQHLFSGMQTIVGEVLADLLTDQSDLIAQIKQHHQIREEISIHQNKTQRIYEIITSPVRANAGLLLHLRDITERKRAESERELLIAELEAYAHTVAHDLKNPLGIIDNLANLLWEDLDEIPAQEAKERLLNIINGTTKMKDIIDALLLFASIRSLDEIEIINIENMGDIIQEALARLTNLITEKQAKIIVLEDKLWPIVSGYAPWIEEVWANYISNAVKYGGVPPIIELGAMVEDDNMVRFWVKDNGSGLSSEEQTQLFTQFTQLGGTLGHGLGLSIVKRIVERLGGRVSVESHVNQGSTFSFTLPTPD